MVFAPVPNDIYNSYVSLENFNKKMSNYEYINYNQKVPLIDTLHFYDSNHLNIYGVEKFDNALLKDLKSMNLF